MKMDRFFFKSFILKEINCEMEEEKLFVGRFIGQDETDFSPEKRTNESTFCLGFSISLVATT